MQKIKDIMKSIGLAVLGSLLLVFCLAAIAVALAEPFLKALAYLKIISY